MREISIASTLLILLVLIVNPMHLWMPSMAHMIMLGLLFVTFGAYTAILWREHARDEREALHRMYAGRYAFIAGAACLTIGIVIETVRDSLDLWLVWTLAIMIFVKMLVRTYSDRHQ